MSHAAEQDRGDDCRDERLQEGPEHADCRLLVADHHVAPRKDVEQFAITPEVAPVLAFGATGFDDQDVFTHAQIRVKRSGGFSSGIDSGTKPDRVHGNRIAAEITHPASRKQGGLPGLNRDPPILKHGFFPPSW